MPKASVRDDYATLKALLPIAQHIIEAAGAAERILNLAASGDNLAARKEQLAKEVAATLAELEEVKRRRDQVVAEHEAALGEFDAERRTYEDRLNKKHADHLAALEQEEQASAAKMAEAAQRHAADLNTAAKTRTAIQNQVATLEKRRDSLKDEIARLVEKYR